MTLEPPQNKGQIITMVVYGDLCDTLRTETCAPPSPHAQPELTEMMYMVGACTELALKGPNIISKNLLLLISPKHILISHKSRQVGASATNPLRVPCSHFKTVCLMDMLRIL